MNRNSRAVWLRGDCPTRPWGESGKSFLAYTRWLCCLQKMANHVKSTKTGILRTPARGNQISRGHLRRLRLALSTLQAWACSDCFHFSGKRQGQPACRLRCCLRPVAGKRSSMHRRRDEERRYYQSSCLCRLLPARLNMVKCGSVLHQGCETSGCIVHAASSMAGCWSALRAVERTELVS